MIKEIPASEMPFAKIVNLHEYEKEKKQYFESFGSRIAELVYYSSHGKDTHWFLLNLLSTKFEVRWSEGKIESVKDIAEGNKAEVNEVITTLIKDYIEKTPWLKNDDKNSGIVKMDDLYVKYGMPMDTYEPTYKRESRYYELIE